MKRFLLVLAAASLGACVAPAPVDSTSQPIINGTTDNDDPAVVMLLAHQAGSQMASLCTGSIVSPHVVLTAAHCVDPATVGTGALFDVFSGTTPSASTPHYAVMETHFNMMFDSMNPQNGNDVGVAILTTPAPGITPIPYNRTTMPQTMVGQPTRIVGYGITSGSDQMGTTAGTKRTAPDTLASLDNLFVGLQDGSHGICEGDSGGPAFMMFNGVERIVGVTSFGFDMCPLTAPAGSGSFEAGNDTRIDTYADFIDQWVEMFDPPAKGPGDMCTSDADCYPRSCVQTSVGKICEQSCDPAAMPATCPAGTMCTDVDGSNLCVSTMPMGGGGSGGSNGGKGGGGCALGGDAPVGGAGLFVALLCLLALRRRAA